jgi:hypothetical protein
MFRSQGFSSTLVIGEEPTVTAQFLFKVTRTWEVSRLYALLDAISSRSRWPIHFFDSVLTHLSKHTTIPKSEIEKNLASTRPSMSKRPVSRTMETNVRSTLGRLTIDEDRLKQEMIESTLSSPMSIPGSPIKDPRSPLFSAPRSPEF